MKQPFLFVGGPWHGQHRDIDLMPPARLVDLATGHEPTPPPTVLAVEHGETYALRSITMALHDATGAEQGFWVAPLYVHVILEPELFQALVQDAAMQYTVRGIGREVPRVPVNGRPNGLILPGDPK